jgi:ABC-type multidrug transport system permease subunit
VNLNRPLLQLILIQFREFYREPGIIFWAIVFPIVMAWGLGIAFSAKGELIKNIAVVEHQNAPNEPWREFLKNGSRIESKRDLGDRVYEISHDNQKLGRTRYRFVVTGWDQAVVLLKRGTIALILEEKPAGMQYHFDPASDEARMIYMQLSALINKTALQVDQNQIAPLTQQGTRYIDFLVPGLLAMGLMSSIMWGIGYSLVEQRTKKLLRRMIATPMKKSSFLISHFVGRTVLCAVEALLLYAFAYYYFDISVQGSIPALLALFLAGVIAFTGIAIFTASRTSRTEIANGLINAVTMPMMVVSGVFFSYHNFPDMVIPFIRLLPLTMLADGIRGIFIEGAGFKEVAASIFILSGLGVVFFGIGLKIYKWY